MLLIKIYHARLRSRACPSVQVTGDVTRRGARAHDPQPTFGSRDQGFAATNGSGHFQLIAIRSARNRYSLRHFYSLKTFDLSMAVTADAPYCKICLCSACYGALLFSIVGQTPGRGIVEYLQIGFRPQGGC